MCIKDPVDSQNVTKADIGNHQDIFNSIQSKHKKSFEVRSSIKIKKEKCDCNEPMLPIQIFKFGAVQT